MVADLLLPSIVYVSQLVLCSVQVGARVCVCLVEAVCMSLSLKTAGRIKAEEMSD